MRLIDIESSMIRAAGYDRKKHVLKIIFNNGHVYHYDDVPLSEYEGLMKAKSKGKYMQENIIDVYDYYQVEDEKPWDA